MKRPEVLQLRNHMYDATGVVYMSNHPLVIQIVNRIRAFLEIENQHFDYIIPINDQINLEVCITVSKSVSLVFFDKGTDENLMVVDPFIRRERDEWIICK